MAVEHGGIGARPVRGVVKPFPVRGDEGAAIHPLEVERPVQIDGGRPDPVIAAADVEIGTAQTVGPIHPHEDHETLVRRDIGIRFQQTGIDRSGQALGVLPGAVGPARDEDVIAGAGQVAGKIEVSAVGQHRIVFVMAGIDLRRQGKRRTPAIRLAVCHEDVAIRGPNAAGRQVATIEDQPLAIGCDLHIAARHGLAVQEQR